MVNKDQNPDWAQRPEFQAYWPGGLCLTLGLHFCICSEGLGDVALSYLIGQVKNSKALYWGGYWGPGSIVMGQGPQTVQEGVLHHPLQGKCRAGHSWRHLDCMILGKLLEIISKPQFPHLWNGYNKSHHCWELKIASVQREAHSKCSVSPKTFLWWCHQESGLWDFPGWSSGWESACRAQGFYLPWSGKIPHDEAQLSLCTALLNPHVESMLCNKEASSVSLHPSVKISLCTP